MVIFLIHLYSKYSLSVPIPDPDSDSSTVGGYTSHGTAGIQHLTCTIPWMIQNTQDPVTPSVTLSTEDTYYSHVGLSNQMCCRVAREQYI